MSAWEWFGVVALVISFAADVQAILKGRRGRGIVLLVVFTVIAIVMALQLRHTGAIEAENRALTDVQARAQRLIDLWTPTHYAFSSQSNSEGKNEGIAVAVADLLEDSDECRPEAYAAARRRVEDARARAAGASSDSPLASSSFTTSRDIWADAADAAYQQLLAVSEVSPVCD